MADYKPYRPDEEQPQVDEDRETALDDDEKGETLEIPAEGSQRNNRGVIFTALFIAGKILFVTVLLILWPIYIMLHLAAWKMGMDAKRGFVAEHYRPGAISLLPLPDMKPDRELLQNSAIPPFPVDLRSVFSRRPLSRRMSTRIAATHARFAVEQTGRRRYSGTSKWWGTEEEPQRSQAPFFDVDEAQLMGDSRGGTPAQRNQKLKRLQAEAFEKFKDRQIIEREKAQRKQDSRDKPGTRIPTWQERKTRASEQAKARQRQAEERQRQERLRERADKSGFF